MRRRDAKGNIGGASGEQTASGKSDEGLDNLEQVARPTSRRRT